VRLVLVMEVGPMGLAVLEGLFLAGHSIAEVWFHRATATGVGAATRGAIKREKKLRSLVRRIQKGQAAKVILRVLKDTRHAAIMDVLDEVGCSRTPDSLAPFGLICVGSKIIFKQPFLDRFQVALNFHPALLPHYRGPHPVAAMVLHGDADRYGGVTLHCLSCGVDEGAIVLQQALPRSSARHAYAWRAQLYLACKDLARDAVGRFIAGELSATPQPTHVGNYAELKPHERSIGLTWSFEMAERVLAEAGLFGLKMPVILTLPPGAHSNNSTTPKEWHDFVRGLPQRISNPTGAPAVFKRTTLEFDILDARILVTRDHRWLRWRRRVLLQLDNWRYRNRWTEL